MMSVIPEREYDGRQMVHSTPRYRGTVTCFTSEDDDQADPSQIWGGANRLQYHHKVGDNVDHHFYMDYNTIDNRTYLLTGRMEWSGTEFDEWHCCIVPKTTVTSAGTDTNYNLFGGYLIIPAQGDGTLTVNDADRVLVEVPLNETGQRSGAGYWDADYNTTTKQFENITANALGEGQFNMFSVEVPFHKYVNTFLMVGANGAALTAFDADMLGHNVRLRFDFKTVGADHEWKFVGNITMFRMKTV